MHEWMDEQIAAGHDVRDNIAREKAKEFAKRIGFPMDRFKASAKWLDKVSPHRVASLTLSSRNDARSLASQPPR